MLDVFTDIIKIILRLDQKSNATGSVEDLPCRPKRHVTTRQHDRFIRKHFTFSNRHRITSATAWHILEHINGLYGWGEINSRVKQFLEFRRPKSHKQIKLPSTRFIILLLLWDFYEMLLCKGKWGTYEMPMLWFLYRRVPVLFWFF